MLCTDYTPKHLLPQSDPLKNRVMVIIHFIIFLVIVSFTPSSKPSGRFVCEASLTGESGVIIVIMIPHSEMRERKPPTHEVISIKILILYQIFKLLFINRREWKDTLPGQILCGREQKGTNILRSVLRWKWHRLPYSLALSISRSLIRLLV